MANYNVYLSAAFTNAIENVTNGIFSISSDGELSSDVVNQLVSFGGTAVKDLDYTWYYSSVDNFSGKIDIVPVDNSAWDASKSVTMTLGKASIEVGFFLFDQIVNNYSVSGTASQTLALWDDEPVLTAGQSLRKSIWYPYTFNDSGLPTRGPDFTTFDDSINESVASFAGEGLISNFGLRWEGYVQIPVSGSYTFFTTADDGVKLYLDEALSINRWPYSAATSDYASARSYSAGQSIKVRLDYYQGTGGASVSLNWTRPNSDGSTTTEVIPSNVFSPVLPQPATFLTASSGALDFSGTSNLDVGNPTQLQLTTGTIEAWIKTADAGSGYRGIVTKAYAYGLFLLDNRLVAFNWTPGNAGIDTGIYLNDGKWHHVALSFQSGVTNGAQVYVDGSAVGSPFTYGVSNNGYDATIGGSSNVTTQNFIGTIDEVRFWDKAFNATEIANYQKAPIGTLNTDNDDKNDIPHLVGYYSLDQATSSLADGSGYGNNLSVIPTGIASSSGLAAVNGVMAEASSDQIYQAFQILANRPYSQDITAKTLISSTGDATTSRETAPTFNNASANALVLDGTTGINVGTNSRYQLSAGTIEAWIKTSNAGSGYRGIVTKAVGAYALFLSDNRLVAYDYYGSGEINTGLYLNDDRWHHVALSFQAGGANTIYVDGQQVKQYTPSAGSDSNGYGLTIGGAGNVSYQNFSGSIDEVRIWNVVRSGTEIAAGSRYPINKAAIPSALIGYYALDEASGSLIDSSSNANTVPFPASGVSRSGPVNAGTVNTSYAQQADGYSTQVGDDFLLYASAADASSSTNALPNSINSVTLPAGQISKKLVVKVLRDPYAESSEKVSLSLLHNAYGQSGDHYAVVGGPGTVQISDASPIVLSVSDFKSPVEGSLGYVELTFSTPIPAGGLRLTYSLGSGTASQGSDYLAPLARLSTDASNSAYTAQRLAFFPEGATKGRIYLSGLEDAIAETGETITLTIVPTTEVNNQGFAFQTYTVSPTAASATLTLADSGAYTPGLALTAQGRTGTAVLPFDGVDDSLKLTWDEAKTGISREIVFRTSKANGGLFQIGSSSASYDRALYLVNGNLASYVDGSETIQTTGKNFADGNWHRLLFTLGSQGGHRLYVDGELLAAGSRTGSSYSTQSAARLGYAAKAAAAPFFAGEIRSLRSWSQELSAKQATGNASALPAASQWFDFNSNRIADLAAGAGDFTSGFTTTGGLSTTTTTSLQATSDNTATLQLKLTSQPTAAVTVQLKVSNASLGVSSLSFNSSNWQTPQTIKLSGVATTDGASVVATATSMDPNYNGTSTTIIVLPYGSTASQELILSEGGALHTATPLVSISSVNSSSEGGTGISGFNLALTSPAPSQGLELFFTLGGSAVSAAGSANQDVTILADHTYRPLLLKAASSQFASMPSLTTGGSSTEAGFTLESWVKLSSATNNAKIFDLGDGNGNDNIRLGLDGTSGKPIFSAYSGNTKVLNLEADQAIPIGEWVHLAATLNAEKQAVLYVNGLAVKTTQAADLPKVKARQYNFIGRSTNSSDAYFDGSIRAARVWNESRSAEQIAADLYATPSTSDANLAEAYELNGSTDSLLAAGSAATLHNGASFDSNPLYSLQVQAGQQQISLPIRTRQDNAVEQDETVVINLLPGPGYGISDGSNTTYTVSDDDSAGVEFAINSASPADDPVWSPLLVSGSASVSESDVADQHVTRMGVRLSSKPSSSVTLTLQSPLSDELSVYASDTTSALSSLVFTADNWHTYQSFNLQGKDDNLDDGDHTQILRWSLTTTDNDYQLVAANLNTTTIDNDATRLSSTLATTNTNASSATTPVATITINSDAQISEGSSASQTVTISLSAAASADTNVFFTTRSAKRGQDHGHDFAIQLPNTVATGLNRFVYTNYNSNAAPLSNLIPNGVDIDGINETTNNFSSLGLGDHFAVRWSGYVLAPYNGIYQFALTTDDGARLYIDDVLVIDEWFDQGASAYTSNPITFKAGTYHRIRYDYYENIGDEVAKLQWIRPEAAGIGTVTETIPSSYLSRFGSNYVTIPKGQTSASFTVNSVDDAISEGTSSLSFEIKAHPQPQVKAISNILTGSGGATISLQLSASVMDSVVLKAGTVLNFGYPIGQGSGTSSVGALTVSQDTTIYRTVGQAVPVSFSAALPPLQGLVAGLSTIPYRSSVNVTSTGDFSSIGLSKSTYVNYTNPAVDLASLIPAEVSIDTDGINETATTTLGAANSYAIRWQGTITIPSTGSYQFVSTAVDGARLSIKDTVVIDEWTTDVKSANSASLNFNAGDKVTLVYDYREQGGSAAASLQWIRPNSSGSGTTKEVIPANVCTVNGHDGQIALKLAESGGIKAKLKAGETIKFSGGTTAEVLTDTTLTTTSSMVNVSLKVAASGATVLAGETAQVSASPRANLSITDNDIAGFLFSTDAAGTQILNASTGSFSISEIGQAVTRYVALKSQPTATVTLSLESSDPAKALLASSANPSGSQLTTLTFTQSNWSIPQAFMVRPVDNLIQDGNVSLNVYAASTSEDGKYHNLMYSDTSASYASKALFSENFNAGAYGWSTPSTASNAVDGTYLGVYAADTVKTNGQDTWKTFPIASTPTRVEFTLKRFDSWEVDHDRFRVYINDKLIIDQALSSQSDTSIHSGSSSGISWSMTPVNDYSNHNKISTKDQSYAVVLTVPAQSDNLKIGFGSTLDQFSFNDESYGIDDLKIYATDGKAFAVTTTDNDTAGVVASVMNGNTQEGGNGFISVVLNSQPTSNVNVTLRPSDDQFSLDDLSIGQSEKLTFTPDNWNLPQVVDVVAMDDNMVEDTTSSQIKFSTSSDDAKYKNLIVSDVAVVVLDNDLPSASLKLLASAGESGPPGRFQIVLNAPAPASLGSTGLVINYVITDVSNTANDLNGSVTSDSIDQIAQTPAASTGSVRIAPGNTTSNSFVVPIDDFYADTTDKSFKLSLASGDGYQLDPAFAAANITIKNDDTAGFMIITSGDQTRVTEGGADSTFQIVLLSQPAADVAVTLTDGSIKAAGSSISQLGTLGTYTFNTSNWYIPQVVTVSANDDNVIEDGTGLLQYTGIHAGQINYSFSSSDTSYNSASHSGQTANFTNTTQAVQIVDRLLDPETYQGLNQSLTALQTGLDSLSLPIVGSLSGKTGISIRGFLNELVESVRTTGNLTAKKLQQLLGQALGYSSDADISNHVSVTIDPDTYDLKVEFKFDDSYDVFSIPLAADFGIPALNLQTNGSVDATFSYEANLDFGISVKDGFYLDTENTAFSANFDTSLSDDFSLTGGLGFLQIDAVNQPSVNENVVINDEPAGTELDVSFDLDLSGDAGSDGKLTLSELISSTLDLEKVFQYELQGAAAMSLGITTSIDGSAAIPSFSFDLSADLPLFDYSNQTQASASSNATAVYFDNITLDLGSFATNLIKPVIAGVDQILKPLYPIVDALYGDTYIFSTLGIASGFDQDSDNRVSVIELAQWFADFYEEMNPGDANATRFDTAVKATVDFLDTVKNVMDLVQELDTLDQDGSIAIDFGAYTLSDFNAADQESSTTTEPVVAAGSRLASGDNTKSDAANTTKGGQFSAIYNKLSELGFAIPIIEDPTTIIQLLFGQTVDLFTWTMPSMGMSSQIDKSFDIYPGIDGVIQGGFGIDAAIEFGFDTGGLERWMQNGFAPEDAWQVFDGFYVADNHDGVDTPEFTLDASMAAGLGLNAVVVEADILGGLEATTALDLIDGGELSGTADGKLRGSEIAAQSSNPLNLFEFTGQLAAFLEASVQVGIDLGFIQYFDTVWQETLATIPIFQFGIGGSDGSGTASNGYLRGATVFFDANFNGVIEPEEPSTITTENASYKLLVDHRTFDSNHNGSIDAEEGELVVYGGIDMGSGAPFDAVFTGPLGSMVTPLTTVYSMARHAGYNDVQARQRLDDLFDLQGFDFLQRDPVLELRQSQVVDLASERAYLAHVKIGLTFHCLLKALQKIVPSSLPNIVAHELQLEQAFTETLLKAPADARFDEALVVSLPVLHANLTFTEKDASAAVADFINDQLCSKLLAGFRQIDAIATNVDGEQFYNQVTGLKSKLIREFQSEMDASKRFVRSDHGISGNYKDISRITFSPPLTTLPDPQVEMNPVSINLELSFEKGSRGSIALDLTTISTGIELDRDFNGQQDANRALLFYTFNSSGVIQSATCDPITGQGARFFDTNHDQRPDLLAMIVEDSGSDDSQSTPDGVFNLSAVAAVAEVVWQLQRLGDGLVVGDQVGSNLPAAAHAQARLLRRAASADEVGYVVRSAPSSAPLSLDEVLAAGHVLFATLPAEGTPDLDGLDFATNLQLRNGQQLMLFSLKDHCLSDLRRASDPAAMAAVSLERLSASIGGDGSAAFKTADGLSFNLALQASAPDLGALIASQQDHASLLDFTALGGKSIQLELTQRREASYDHQLGFYEVADHYGRVVRTDAVTGQVMRDAAGILILVSPDDADYTSQALAHRVNVLDNLSVADGETKLTSITVEGGQLLAPYAVVRAAQDITYFAFPSACPDQMTHFRSFGQNVIGLEDLFGLGDNDFDDHLLSVTVKSLVV